MCDTSPWEHATAVGSVDSTFTITSRTGATTLLTPMAHSTQQAGCSRPTACQASRRVAWMQVSTVSQQQHACMSTAGVVAHCAAVPHRCPSAGDGVHPALPEHVGSDCSATCGSFSTGIETVQAGKRGLHGQRGQRERHEHARERRGPSFYLVVCFGPAPYQNFLSVFEIMIYVDLSRLWPPGWPARLTSRSSNTS